MRRRITAAIVGVATFVLLILGIPLGVVVQRSILRSEMVALDGDVARTLAEIETPLDPTQLAGIGGEPDAPPPFGVYTPDGALLFGSGPTVADAVTTEALAQGTAHRTGAHELVVATQLVDRDEQVVGVLRLAEPRDDIDAKTRTAWLVMLGAGAMALAVAWMIARRLARQLTRPLADLSAVADDLATGVTREAVTPSGVPEIDELATALHHSANQITAALARERRFSADVSHQLRTPLTGLRLHLEDVLAHEPDHAGAAAALADLDRVDRTVVELLAFAQGTADTGGTIALRPVLIDASTRRRTRPRRIEVVGPDVIVRAAAAPLGQALDVLVDNAVRHGRGDITIQARPITGGVAVDVRDEGSLETDRTDDELFRRGSGDDHGIGLSLARDLVEADGGRLTLTSRRPTTFTITLLSAPE